jgi:hypothetical protein
MAATSLINRQTTLPHSISLPGINHTTGVPGHPATQPAFLRSKATPLHAWTGFAELEVDQVVNVSFNIQPTEEFRSVVDDLGKDLLTFQYTDPKESKERKHITCYAKSLQRLNIYMKSVEGRRRYGTCSSDPIKRDWRFVGCKVSIDQEAGVHAFHVHKRARTADVWAWNGRARRDGKFLWLVAMVMGPRSAGRRSADDEIPESDPALRKLPAGCYWALVPMETDHPSPPSSRDYVNSRFTGHALYIGRMMQYLEGNSGNRIQNRANAVASVFSDASGDAWLKATHRLPFIEVQLGVR